jgi:hypothetical protein
MESRTRLSRLALLATVCILWPDASSPGQGPSVLQTSSDQIEWSKDRKLRRADFKGVAVMQAGVAARSSIGIKASWTCDGDRLDAKILAVFDTSQSTWPGAMRSGFDASSPRPTLVTNRDILQHEQTHFDIAEVIARKIRAHFAALDQVCTRRGGTVPLAAIVEDYQQELDEQQARYDRQTLFGADGRAQSMWTSQTLKALADTDKR